MPQLLVTTFERVLHVTLTRTNDLASVRVLHDGLGIYFGMAQLRGRLWIAERNLDINKTRRVGDAPLNGITGWKRSFFGGFRRVGPTITDQSFDDLHQIAGDGHALYVTTGNPPFLVRREISTDSTFGHTN
jgi:hypothetical protein